MGQRSNLVEASHTLPQRREVRQLPPKEEEKTCQWGRKDRKDRKDPDSDCLAVAERHMDLESDNPSVAEGHMDLESDNPAGEEVLPRQQQRYKDRDQGTATTRRREGAQYWEACHILPWGQFSLVHHFAR